MVDLEAKKYHENSPAGLKVYTRLYMKSNKILYEHEWDLVILNVREKGYTKII